MNTAFRAALTAALALPLAAPAPASSLMPVSQFGQQLQGQGLSPKFVFQKLHAHHSSKKPGHFSFPYGLGIDGAGNLYVGNIDSEKIVIVSPDYKVLTNTITSGISTPVSVATDTYGDVYVGNEGNNTVTKYNSSLSLVQTITANTSAPYSIAVDQAQDVYLITGSGLAVDDPYGNSISSNIYSGSLDSVAVGGPNVYTFYNNFAAFGNISVALRGAALQYLDGPLNSAVPAGSACSATQSFCWYDDSQNNVLYAASLPGYGYSVGLSYTPVGLAYDPVRNRVYIADPSNNAIHVYNASTLALEKTII